MTTTYQYPDAFLAKHCTPEREARALADVGLIATAAGVTFSAAWTERLTVVQCYVMACLENQASAEDLFSVKLKSYRAQLDTLTTQAIAAALADADEVVGVGYFTVPLERA